MRAQRVAAGRFLREGDALRVRGGFGKGTLTKDLGGAMAAWEGDLTWIGVGGVGVLRVDCRGGIPNLNTCRLTARVTGATGAQLGKCAPARCDDV